MYSPPGLVTFVAVEGIFVHFTNVTITISNSIRCGKTNAISRACEAAYRNALAILAVVTARRQRIAPFDIRCASLPVAVAIFYNVS